MSDQTEATEDDFRERFWFRIAISFMLAMMAGVAFEFGVPGRRGFGIALEAWGSAVFLCLAFYGRLRHV